MMKPNQWRLLITSPNNGAWNMAVDEAILTAVIEDAAPPTLRLYSWSPYCLSLGQAQHVSEVDMNYLENSGWDLVRRPTGGRAILHADELTYSVCASINDPHVQGGVIESYRKISTGLLQALRNVGIDADSNLKDADKSQLSKDPVCFQYPSDYEITFAGKKIIGSAQARRANALLQHGAIPLFGDITRIVSCLIFESPEKQMAAAENLKMRAGTAAEAKGSAISWHDLGQALISAFASVFQITLIRQQLSDRELAQARDLFQKKYNHADWTNKI